MMFKKISALLAAMAILAGGMTACNKNDLNPNETEQNAETSANGAFDYQSADLTKYVTLCDYKGLTLEKKITPITEAEIDAQLESLREEYSHYEYIYEGTVEEGDTVLCDFAGYKDGVAYEGGTATGAEVTAKSDSGYIPGFAEAFIGQTPGVEFSFDVTFPEEYQNTDLAGQEVTFVCKVQCIYSDVMTVPEINDEFAKEYFQCENVEELRALIADRLQVKTDYAAENDMYSTLFDYIIENSTFLEYPEEEVNRLYEEYSSTYKTYAEYYGMEYEAFLEYYMGKTVDDVKEDMRKYVQEDLIMYSLIKELNAELTDIEYSEQIVRLASLYNMDAEEFEGNYGKDRISATLLWADVMRTIAGFGTVNEVIVEPTAETEAAE